MRAMWFLTLGPNHEPIWVRLYVQAIGVAWAAMIVADNVLPPEPGELKGVAFFASSAAKAEEAANVYLAHSEPGN